MSAVDVFPDGSEDVGYALWLRLWRMLPEASAHPAHVRLGH